MLCIIIAVMSKWIKILIKNVNCLCTKTKLWITEPNPYTAYSIKIGMHTRPFTGNTVSGSYVSKNTLMREVRVEWPHWFWQSIDTLPWADYIFPLTSRILHFWMKEKGRQQTGEYVPLAIEAKSVSRHAPDPTECTIRGIKNMLIKQSFMSNTYWILLKTDMSEYLAGRLKMNMV